MIRAYIYNEIKKAANSSVLFSIQQKIIRAEHFGNLDTKSADLLLQKSEKQLNDIQRKIKKEGATEK